jgi:mRNA-degrading endonuclease RelE of RelBE toxin-antitoxin system
MIYRIKYDNTNLLKKDKQKLFKKIKEAKKIKLSLEKLSINPFSNFLDVKKLEPKFEKKFRLKINNYRIIFSIDFGNKIIIIHRI